MINYKAFYLLPSCEIFKIEYSTDNPGVINEILKNEDLVALKLDNVTEKITNKEISFIDKELLFALDSDNAKEIIKTILKTKQIEITYGN